MLTLQQLKNYLQTHGQTSLLKLASEFNEQPDYIMFIAEHYINKNKIVCQRKTVNCGTKCHNCIASQLVTLCWVNN